MEKLEKQIVRIIENNSPELAAEEILRLLGVVGRSEQQCAIHDISCSFYEFAKNYIKIKDGANERSFNDEELKQVKEIQQMMDKGYELRLVHLRKGSKIMWCKKNCT